ncbi:MAG: cobalamin biosynthesis protein CobG [Tateyamaria sp.]|uniref:cobalamin biosynthesis protein CobG n=1 Tax=Tateyamaria sp. TaxID=1929288 RepID=UPI00328F78CE
MSGPSKIKGQIKGWCPGAYTPMMSGDGLIVRIRPRLGRLTSDQALGLCAIAQAEGNGIIDLTSRANLQLRGIKETGHEAVLSALLALGVLDDTPERETRRNIVTTPLWQADDLNTRLYDAVCDRLDDLPDLPAKMGIAIDAGPSPILPKTSADFRFERTADGALLLRLNGLSRGRLTNEDTAIDALCEMAQWFADTQTTARRMAGHVAMKPPPADWMSALPAAAILPLSPSNRNGTVTLGVAFGSLEAASLSALIHDSDATAFRVTPWRLFQLENAILADAHGFITAPNDPLLTAHACPGAPACAAATVDTRQLARALAPAHRDLHVSGCSKGCAYRHAAATTLVGHDGTYDLVKQGHPWDQPCQRGLSASDLKAQSDAL